ncbi:MAG: Uma2 family endonuclease [Blastocatellales bacterium]
MAWQPARKLFTTAEYHQLIEAGVLGEDDRVELLNGEILEMSPIGPRHAACVDRLNETLTLMLKGQAKVRVQNPVELGEFSEPEPDLTLLKPREDFYASGHPAPADILIAIEVADSTIEKDRNLKIPAYAAAGIPEIWLVDLLNDRIEIHSNPLNTIYQEVRIIQRGQKFTSPTLPKLKLKADDILV